MSKKKDNWNYPKQVFVIFLIVFLLLYLQFAYLALSPKVYGIDMDSFAANRNTVKTTLSAKRGTIYDTLGNPLALNVSSYTVIAYLDENRSKNSSVPLHVVDKEKTAQELAPILNMTEEQLLNLLNKNVYQVELGPGGRGITELKKEEITNLQLPGIDFIESQKRYYPNGDFASYILGYAKTSTIKVDATTEEVLKEEDITVATKYKTVEKIVGELGIEGKYNELLTGKDGFLQYERDRFGYKIPDTKEHRTDAIDGSEIYLTIDSNIQRFAETVVKEQSEIYNPEWMILVAMDAKTGEILASASMPSFDPNIRNLTSYENPLSSYAYEPGSTMKTYTYMCALEKGTYKGDELYQSGTIEVDNEGNIIKDWDPRGWGNLTYDQGYAYSSNVAITNIVKNFITREDLKDCFQKYGFGSQTGIELPRELSGTVEFTYPLEVATAGFGQGITTTPIQHLQALSILANDGVMIKPKIISKMVNPNTGEITYEASREELGRKVSSQTAQKMLDLMDDAVNASWALTSATALKNTELHVVGKSGTAQIFDNKTGQYEVGENNYIFSFATMFPKENPEIIIYSAMKKPEKGTAIGLAKATNTFIENTAKYLQIEVQEEPMIEEKIENYINKNVTTLESLKENYRVLVFGDGDTIVSQYPMTGSSILKNDKLFFITNSSTYKMPDLTGFSRSDVLILASLLNFQYEMDGYGYVVSQSIPPETIITEDVIQIKLENKTYIEEIKREESS